MRKAAAKNFSSGLAMGPKEIPKSPNATAKKINIENFKEKLQAQIDGLSFMTIEVCQLQFDAVVGSGSDFDFEEREFLFDEMIVEMKKTFAIHMF